MRCSSSPRVLHARERQHKNPVILGALTAVIALITAIPRRGPIAAWCVPAGARLIRALH